MIKAYRLKQETHECEHARMVKMLDDDHLFGTHLHFLKREVTTKHQIFGHGEL